MFTPSNKLTSLALLALAGTSEAFIQHHKTQFHVVNQVKSLATRAPTGTTQSYMPISSTTSLSANFFDRFFRVANANVNKFVSGLENPEKVIVQAVEDMQNDLIRIRQAYSTAVASSRRLERQMQQAEATADDWKNRANLALRRGNEGLAREALARRQPLVEKANGLRQQLATQQAATDKLYAAMSQLEGKIQEAAVKKEQLVARARTAKSTQQVNDMLSGLTGKTSMDAFTRMEEKVEALEAAAEASLEMAGSIPDSVEADFLMLEMSVEVDDELAKMRKEMKLLNSAPAQTPIRERVAVSVGRDEGSSSRYIR